MAVSDWMTPGYSSKQRVKIVTVDPPTRRIEGILKDSSVIQIAVWEIPPLFVWPQVEEYWSVFKENGYWMLGSRMEVPEDDILKKVENLTSGQGRAAANTIWTPNGNYVVTTPSTDPNIGDVLTWDGTNWVAEAGGGGGGGGSWQALDSYLFNDSNNGWFADSPPSPGFYLDGDRCYWHGLVHFERAAGIHSLTDALGHSGLIINIVWGGEIPAQYLPVEQERFMVFKDLGGGSGTPGGQKYFQLYVESNGNVYLDSGHDSGSANYNQLTLDTTAGGSEYLDLDLGTISYRVSGTPLP